MCALLWSNSPPPSCFLLHPLGRNTSNSSSVLTNRTCLATLSWDGSMMTPGLLSLSQERTHRTKWFPAVKRGNEPSQIMFAVTFRARVESDWLHEGLCSQASRYTDIFADRTTTQNNRCRVPSGFPGGSESKLESRLDKVQRWWRKVKPG